MGKSKGKQGSKGSLEPLKIPCTFDDYKLKKTTGEMIVSFAIPVEKLDLAKPLLNCVQEPFILLLFKPESQSDIDMLLTLDPGELA